MIVPSTNRKSLEPGFKLKSGARRALERRLRVDFSNRLSYELIRPLCPTVSTDFVQIAIVEIENEAAPLEHCPSSSEVITATRYAAASMRGLFPGLRQCVLARWACDRGLPRL